MAKDNQIRDGKRKKKYDRSDISPKCKWSRGDNSAVSIRCMNRAFELYYLSKNSIASCSSPILRKQMEKKLASACEEGWGTGVQDFNDAIDHAWEHIDRHDDYQWLDTNQGTYMPGTRSVFNERALVKAPKAVVNFLEELDDESSILASIAFDAYSKKSKELIAAFEGGKYTSAIQAIKELKSGANKVKSMVWLAPDKVKTKVEKANKYISYLGTITKFDSFLKDYGKFQNSGFNNKASAAFAAMKVVVGYVPILGDFYGGAIDMIPNLTTNFREMHRKRQEKILAISRST